jgi:tagatose 1,6-diphosphate aldolase
VTTPTTADPRSIGRLRRLRRLADESGIVVGLAIDHRDSFRAALERAGFRDVSPDVMARVKEALVRSLVGSASTLMIDLELGRGTLDNGALPARVGLVMPLESQGYQQLGDDRTTTLMSDFTPPDALALGADACKVLLPIRLDRPRAAAAQLETLARAISAAHDVALPIVVEPTVYKLTGETDASYGARFRDLLHDLVGAVSQLGPDLLKVPFPLLENARSDGIDEGATAACQELDRAAGGIPWVLLGAGVAPPQFLWQLDLAGRAGASGFLAGRTIWFDALSDDPKTAASLAVRHGRPRFEECRAVARAACRPLPA